MTITNYYKWSLALPIVAIGAVSFIPNPTILYGDPDLKLLGIILGPYLGLATWLLFKSKSDSEKSFQVRLLFSPLLYALMFSALLITLSIYDYALHKEGASYVPGPSDILLTILIVNLFLIPISYFFVSVAFALRVILSYFDILSTDHPNKRMQSDHQKATPFDGG